jgi:hypothetical protein
VLDAKERATRLATRAGSAELQAREGVPLVLEFGAADGRGLVPLWVAASETLFLVEGSLFELALPTRELLSAEHGEANPWSAAARPVEAPR